METAFEFEVGNEQIPVRVDSWDDLISWLDSERAKWEWLVRGGPTEVANQIATHVQNQWDSILSAARQRQAQGVPLHEANGVIANLRPDGALLASITEDGAQVLDIRATNGDVSAAFSYAFLIKRLEWSQVKSVEGFLGVMLTAIPTFGEPAALTGLLKAERRSYREAMKSGVATIGDELAAQNRRMNDLFDQGNRLAFATLKARKKEWKEAQADWSQKSSDAVDAINAVKVAFLEQIALDAPVDYWLKKARAHSEEAEYYRNLLIWFFVFLPLGLGWGFHEAAQFLTGAQGGDDNHPSAVYFIVSGALLVMSTLGFWVGRLLTKLYLSAQHLRTDADERAVMTKTYLALTKERATSEAERHIILSALFRNSSDGIVRDDGMPDLGLQSALSKIAAR